MLLPIERRLLSGSPLGRNCGGDAATVAVSQHRQPTPLLLRKPDPVRPVSLQKIPGLALERHHSSLTFA
eukprot:scaffold87254_cov72-Phaeocystis_antarctica.AAC.4